MDHRSLLVIDIETTPDRDHFTGEGFPKPLFHKVVVICFLSAEIERQGDKDLYHLTEMRCRGEASYGEKELIQAFFPIPILMPSARHSKLPFGLSSRDIYR